MGITAGFIGLGNMGKPIANNILKHVDTLLISDHHMENMCYLAKQGATILDDPAQIATHADVIFLSLPGPKQVHDVMEGPNGLLQNGHDGQYIIDLSTIDVASSQELSRQAQMQGILYVDAPVSGGVKNAAAGTLSVMLGATQNDLEKVSPLIQCIGTKLHFMGKRGCGSAIKVINNFMSFAIQIVNAEALVMADHAGIPFDTFYNVVSSSSGGNFTLTAKKDKIRTNDLNASFTVDLVVKDLELALQMCKNCEISNFSLASALQWYRLAQHNGYAKKDSSSVVRMIRDLELPPAEV